MPIPWRRASACRKRLLVLMIADGLLLMGWRGCQAAMFGSRSFACGCWSRAIFCITRRVLEQWHDCQALISAGSAGSLCSKG